MKTIRKKPKFKAKINQNRIPTSNNHITTNITKVHHDISHTMKLVKTNIHRPHKYRKPDDDIPTKTNQKDDTNNLKMNEQPDNQPNNDNHEPTKHSSSTLSYPDSPPNVRGLKTRVSCLIYIKSHLIYLG